MTEGSDEHGSIAGTLARRVAQVRVARGYSLQGLAQRLRDLGYRTDASALMRLEKGQRRATVADLAAIALALDTSPDVLVTSPDDERGLVWLTDLVAEPAREVRQWWGGRRNFSPTVRMDGPSWPLVDELTDGATRQATARRMAANWLAERPPYEQRAWEQEGVSGLTTAVHEYVRVAGHEHVGEREREQMRRQLRTIRRELDRQFEILDNHEGDDGER